MSRQGDPHFQVAGPAQRDGQLGTSAHGFMNRPSPGRTGRLPEARSLYQSHAQIERGSTWFRGLTELRGISGITRVRGLTRFRGRNRTRSDFATSRPPGPAGRVRARPSALAIVAKRSPACRWPPAEGEPLLIAIRCRHARREGPQRFVRAAARVPLAIRCPPALDHSSDRLMTLADRRLRNALTR
jgi:hypothetical protein